MPTTDHLPPVHADYGLDPSIDLDAITDAAEHTAALLRTSTRPVEALIAPNDGTQYRILVAGERNVAGNGLSFCSFTDCIVVLLTPTGRAWPWNPENSGHTDAAYVLDHWTDQPWTATVLAAFLNQLRRTLHGEVVR